VCDISLAAVACVCMLVSVSLCVCVCVCMVLYVCACVYMCTRQLIDSHLRYIGNSYGNAGLRSISEAVAKNGSLRELYLTRTRIFPCGAGFLPPCCCSHFLHDFHLGSLFADSDFTEEEVTHLGDALKLNSSLKTLSLWSKCYSFHPRFLFALLSL